MPEYTPPAFDAVDFELQEYTTPAFDAVDFSASAEAVVATQQCGFESLAGPRQTFVSAWEGLEGVSVQQQIAWEGHTAAPVAPSPYRPRRPATTPDRRIRPATPVRRY